MKKVLKSIMYAALFVVAVGLFALGVVWIALHYPIVLLELVGVTIFLMITALIYNSLD